MAKTLCRLHQYFQQAHIQPTEVIKSSILTSQPKPLYDVQKPPLSFHYKHITVPINLLALHETTIINNTKSSLQSIALKLVDFHQIKYYNMN